MAVNVTVTAPTSAGDLTFFPGRGVAPVTTTIPFAAGKTRATNALVGLAGGVLSVTNRQEAGSVHVIVDVSGTFR